MKNRRGNGPFGKPHWKALQFVLCTGCLEREPTFWHRRFGGLCGQCWKVEKVLRSQTPNPTQNA